MGICLKFSPPQQVCTDAREVNLGGWTAGAGPLRRLFVARIQEPRQPHSPAWDHGDGAGFGWLTAVPMRRSKAAGVPFTRIHHKLTYQLNRARPRRRTHDGNGTGRKVRTVLHHCKRTVEHFGEGDHRAANQTSTSRSFPCCSAVGKFLTGWVTTWVAASTPHRSRSRSTMIWARRNAICRLRCRSTEWST